MPATATPPSPRFVAYLRVSTTKQGATGLGIDAQRTAVRDYVRRCGDGAEVLHEYVETESGNRNDRPQLTRAIEHCHLSGARLVIAKLDRLARNAAFLIGLRDTGVDFVAADMPEADKFTVGVLALVAEREREVISQRTKAALAEARRRGTRLGNPNGAAALRGKGNTHAVARIKAKAEAGAERYRTTLAALRKDGIVSAQGTARAFNERGFRTPRGGQWTATGVIRLTKRLGV